MAAEIELKKINEYVQECLAITSITGSYVYGIDSNGNSIKIAVEVLASAGSDYSQQINELTRKCNNNTTLITTLQSAVNGKANSVHTHQISDVADLQTALDGKSNTGHTHVISDVAGLQTALNGKADANHTHGMSAIVGLTDALNSKANSVHTHAIGDVANLQPTLANHESRITELEEQGGDTSGNALKQVDLTEYSGSNGEIVQHVGETTEDYINGYTYKCAAGEVEKTIPAGTRCVRMTQGGEEYISDGETDTTTTRMVMVLQPTADGVTYYVFASSSIATADIEKLVGTYVPDDTGAIHTITAITHNGSSLTSVTLDNGVTLEINSSTRVKSTLAWYEYFSKSGERYYGGSGSVGYMIASKTLVSSTDGSQSYPIATEPIGTAFGGTVGMFTASEDIVIRSVTWTQSPTQPETSVASGDTFLTQTDGAIGSTITLDYNSTNQHLELKGINGAVVAFVDMAVFIKDGMLENVEKFTTPEQGVSVAVPYLKFTFNTDSGKSVIRISFADLIDTFDGSNVDLTSAFVKAAQYSAPAIGDSMNVAIGKLLKGHEDNAAAIATKQDTLTFDSTPTANSTRPVTSQGIKAAIDSAVGSVAALKQVDLTTYQGADGEIVQHIGETTSQYTHGYVYKATVVETTIPAQTTYYTVSDASGELAKLGVPDGTYYQVETVEDEVTSNFVWHTWDLSTSESGSTLGTVCVYDAQVGSYIEEFTEIGSYVLWNDKFLKITSIRGLNERGGLVQGTSSNNSVLVLEDGTEAKLKSQGHGNDTPLDLSLILTFQNENGGKFYQRKMYSSSVWTYQEMANAYRVVGPWNKSQTLNGGTTSESTVLRSQEWQRINVQPSSEGAVSDLETRMTAAETAISGKQATITGAATTITDSNLTASKILGSDANGKVEATSIATTDAEDAVAKRHTQNTDTQIVSGNNKVEVSASGTTITGNGSVTGNFSISGDLNVTGKETVEEIVNIKSENNFITLRDGAQTAIASGDISGTKVENYDGLGNDLLFGTDASGVFRIGDNGGTLEPIATRDEAANLTDGQLMKWDAANQRMVGINDIRANTVNGAPLSNSASYFYGVSTSAAADTIKTVSIPSITTLNVGQVIVVLPTVTSNTIQNATLKLNDFTAYPIIFNGNNNVSPFCWNNFKPTIFIFNGSKWVSANELIYPLNVSDGIAGTSSSTRYVRADYLQQIIHGQIDKFVGTRAMTEDAYWDLVAAGTVQADTLYITFDNDYSED